MNIEKKLNEKMKEYQEFFNNEKGVYYVGTDSMGILLHRHYESTPSELFIKMSNGGLIHQDSINLYEEDRGLNINDIEMTIEAIEDMTDDYYFVVEEVK